MADRLEEIEARLADKLLMEAFGDIRLVDDLRWAVVEIKKLREFNGNQARIIADLEGRHPSWD